MMSLISLSHPLNSLFRLHISQLYILVAKSPIMTKSCTLCSTPRDILIRCQIDETAKWHFVCPGACWKSVSGGVEDARGLEGKYPYYRYGGMVRLNLEMLKQRSLLLMGKYSGKIEVPMDLLVRRNLERLKRGRRKK